jgi:putative CocE/NonD family hydrolase
MIIGPWGHTKNTGARYNVASLPDSGFDRRLDFGPDAEFHRRNLFLRWHDHWLKGIDNGVDREAPIKIFVMGENRWRDEQEFPLARTRYTRLYLHSRRSPATAAGDGTLEAQPPGPEPPATFGYDPLDPVRTIGGRLCCGAVTKPGPYDQRPSESRPDVLVFSTPPLERDLEVTGNVRLELFAASSAVDTDFTALLADVDPTGYARFLTDGIVRGRYRDSTERASLMDPGHVYELDVDLWATSNLFKAGHRIRLYVSSSNFPRFDRNPNTGEAILGATRVVKARQTVHHDRARPSALVLPAIPR